MFKFIVIDSGSSASKLMFSDIKNVNNAIETSKIFNISNLFLRVLNKIHMSGKINRLISLPLKKVWDKFYITEVVKEDIFNKYVIIMTNISVKKFRIDYLKQLSKLPNVYLVLVAVDSLVDKKLSPLNIIKNIKFDIIYSFDKEDCKKYNLIYTNALYSKRENINPSKESSDVFFIGRAKDRLTFLKEFAKKANSQKIKCNFLILDVPINQREKIDGITYLNRVKKYDEVLPMILASKCLLDIVQNGQKGLTMRVYEAIFYNKRLITNNDSIINLTYYNKDNMLIIKDSNVDKDFIISDKVVNYNYKGEYSSINLLNDINMRLK